MAVDFIPGGCSIVYFGMPGLIPSAAFGYNLRECGRRSYVERSRLDFVHRGSQWSRKQFVSTGENSLVEPDFYVGNFCNGGQCSMQYARWV